MTQVINTTKTANVRFTHMYKKYFSLLRKLIKLKLKVKQNGGIFFYVNIFYYKLLVETTQYSVPQPTPASLEVFFVKKSFFYGECALSNCSLGFRTSKKAQNENSTKLVI